MDGAVRVEPRPGMRQQDVAEWKANVNGKPFSPAHYRDFLLNVQLSNGAIFELQINTPQMLAAKEELGHTFYEITDQIHENGIIGENISFDEQTEIDRFCDVASWKLYDAAFNAALEGASFNTSSLDMTSELVAISDHFHEGGANSKLLSDKTLKSVLLWSTKAKGLSSQDTNVSRESSKEGNVISFTSVPSISNIIQNEKVFKDYINNISKIIDENGEPVITDNAGTFSRDDYSILFQMTREDVQAEAMRFESWQYWMKADVFAEAVGDQAAYRLDDVTAEPQTKADIEAWYEKQWNEAQVLAREAALGDQSILISGV